jgi:hypothetical protein
MSITYDIKKKFNAQSTLKGNKVDVFHETNPSLVANKKYENYKRTIDISALEKFNITPYCFPDRINYENISNIIYHPHKPEPGITSNQINLTQRQIVNDLINHTPNMYNGLDIKRCALKREPIIPQSSYLRGLLNEKDLEIVRMGTTPKPQIPPPAPPAPPTDDYGKDKYAMEKYENKMIRDSFKEHKAIKEAKHKTNLTIKALSGKQIKKNTTDRIQTLGKVIEKAKIGQPVNHKPVLGETIAIGDLEDRLGENTKKKLGEIQEETKQEKMNKATKIQALVRGELDRRNVAKLKDVIKKTTKIQALVRGVAERKKMKKQEEEAVVSSSLSQPKPQYDDDDDDDDKSTGSGETSYEDTNSMADHKTKLQGWGIKQETLDRISFSTA